MLFKNARPVNFLPGSDVRANANFESPHGTHVDHSARSLITERASGAKNVTAHRSSYMSYKSEAATKNGYILKCRRADHGGH